MSISDRDHYQEKQKISFRKMEGYLLTGRVRLKLNPKTLSPVFKFSCLEPSCRLPGLQMCDLTLSFRSHLSDNIQRVKSLLETEFEKTRVHICLFKVICEATIKTSFRPPSSVGPNDHARSITFKYLSKIHFSDILSATFEIRSSI